MRLVWCIDSPAGITQVPELTGWQPVSIIGDIPTYTPSFCLYTSLSL